MKKFIEGTPAIKDLREAVQNTLISESKWVDGENIVKWKRRWLKGLDGRRIHIRSPHSALNALLQGDGAVVVSTGLSRPSVCLKKLATSTAGKVTLRTWLGSTTNCKLRVVPRRLPKKSSDCSTCDA
ncbi:DNA polymerase [Enterobacter phage 03_vB_Eclo_IJM]|nr:DNA polymerase [Enterobacter phage 03_vB_Eclo_IJM]